MPCVRVIGGGRAGRSFAAALAAVGWDVQPILGRSQSPKRAAAGVDLVVIATPDETIAAVARAISSVETTVVAHLAGSLGLDVLSPHRRRAAIHPLMSLPDALTGSRLLRAGGWFAVAGDELAARLVADLGGRSFSVADEVRAQYHAAAVVASNHLVGLLGQVERIALAAGVPFEPFCDLARATLENVAELGPAAALTGPAARGDEATIEAHLAALDPGERGCYEALLAEARRLAEARPLVEGPSQRIPAQREPEQRESEQREPVENPPAGSLHSGKSPAGSLHSGKSAAGGSPVEVITGIALLRERLAAFRAAGESIGFVATMGALHAGHRSLMDRARAETDRLVVSIFVNPLQFAPQEDLDDYPRDLDLDLEVCTGAAADVVFVPALSEMYPDTMATTVSVTGLMDGLEALARPGHLDGVASVVTRLLSIVGPCSTYFGEKDFQQLAVVRRLVVDLSMPVEVVGCPTVRAADGLALSSRNAYLNDTERRQATLLRRALDEGLALLDSGERDAAVIERAMTRLISDGSEAEIDYVAALPAATLRPAGPLCGEVRLLVAARFGRARLIDNAGYEIP